MFECFWFHGDENNTSWYASEDMYSLWWESEDLIVGEAGSIFKYSQGISSAMKDSEALIIEQTKAY